MLAFALAFKFVVVSLQAAKLKLTAPIAAIHNHSFVLIFASFLSNVPEKESPASPFAGDSVAEILNSFADFSPGPPDRLLNSSFKPFLLAAVFEVAVTGQATKMFFRRADDLLPFSFYFVFVSHYFPLVLEQANPLRRKTLIGDH
jgi:hypothetical protein